MTTKTTHKYTPEELRLIEIDRRKLALLCDARAITRDFITLARIGAQMRAKRAERIAAA